MAILGLLRSAVVQVGARLLVDPAPVDAATRSVGGVEARTRPGSGLTLTQGQGWTLAP